MTPTRASQGGALVVCLALGLVSLGCLGCKSRADAATRTTHEVLPGTGPYGGDKLGLDVSRLAADVRPSVVSIEATRDADVDGLSFHRPRASGAARQLDRAIGSGFFVSNDGLVATNAHVIHGSASVVIELADGRQVDAVVLGEDEKLDVALLSAEGASGFPPVTFGSSDALRVGDYIVAIGNPFGLDHTVTLGIVSAKERVLGVGPFDHLVQTDASINPGSSGGPLFDAGGCVVGMSTVMNAHGQGIGFAIPIDDVRAVLDDLRAEGRVRRGVAGLAFQAISRDLGDALELPAPRGALVTDVEAGGPASRVGITPGDVILAADGRDVGHASELSRALSRKKPGDVMRLRVWRDGKTREAPIVLARASHDEDEALAERLAREAQTRPRSGLGADVVDEDGGGARIDALDPRGAGARGLEVGDIVLEANGRPIRRGGDLTREVSHARTPGTMLLRLRREGEIVYVAVRLR